MIGVSVVCVLLVAVSHQTTARKLPPYIKPCSPARADFNQCVLRAVEDVRPHLANGIPEMHIPQMEPLLVSSATLDAGNFVAAFENSQLYGLTKFKVRDVNFDVKNNRIALRVDFDEIQSFSDYRVKGRILILDLNGAGKANATFYNPKATAVLQGHRSTVRGKEYLIFDTIDLDADLKNGKMYYADLFKGNPELTENTNRIVNDNIVDILGDLKPVINKTIGDIILLLVKQVFERFSVDELFLNN